MDFRKLLENKMFMMLMGGLVVLIIVIIVVTVMSSFNTGRVRTFSELEAKLTSAAQDYYKDEASRLPKTVGTTTTISASSLSSDGYIKSLDDISPKGSTCSGEVVVKNVNGNHLYQAYLDCGSSYSTEQVSDYILANTNVVSSGAGLYKNGDSYYYRGENPNNYITFAGMSYRIVKINADGTMDIIANEKRTRAEWDDRYNNERESNVGVNTYSLSRAKDSLLAFINSESFQDIDRLMMEPFSLCVGKVSENSAYTLEQECSTKIDNELVGLLPLSNYLYASLDSSCVNVMDGACENYNYLANYVSNWWTLTADADSTYKVFDVYSGGGLGLVRASNSYGLREVIRLTEQAVYVSGEGTEESPYTIK